MAQPIRYQPQDLYGRQGDVDTHLGLDPLTGLPVLIYTFPGAPTVGVGVLESENIPGILASEREAGRGMVVIAYSSDYGLVAPGEITLTPDFVVEAARGLRDAARSGVIHGDLHPGRFLHAEGHVLIEGYGVPWTPEAEDFVAPERPEQGSYAGDVYSFGRAMLHLGRSQFPTGLVVALERALVSDPEARPDANELYESVKAALSVTRTPPEPQRVEAGFSELTLPVEDEQVETVFGAGPMEASGTGDLDLGFDDAFEELPPASWGADPEPLTIHTDSGQLRTTPAPLEPPPLGAYGGPGEPSTVDSGPGFVKDLPPGATYRTGEVDAAAPPAAFTFDFEESAPTSSTDWRRIGLIAAITLVVAAAVTATFMLRARTNFAVGGGSGIHYLVEVGVEPSNLPPATLIVVDSPAQSRWRPGTIFGTVPGQVVLDREGRWSFVGEYQGRRSEVVTLEVPIQRNFTLTIPPPPPDEEP
jgi:hypothetical protein